MPLLIYCRHVLCWQFVALGVGVTFLIGLTSEESILPPALTLIKKTLMPQYHQLPSFAYSTIKHTIKTKIPVQNINSAIFI
jgi:hypothetical protein